MRTHGTPSVPDPGDGKRVLHGALERNGVARTVRKKPAVAFDRMDEITGDSFLKNGPQN